VPRHARLSIDDALADTRVVLVNGARQCGKSTLVRLAGKAGEAVWQTLDNESNRQAAQEDPPVSSMSIRRW
jgi:predicted AAA+ superfamily ATPase